MKRTLAIIGFCLCVLPVTTGASATQHLVSPGTPWEGLANKLRPGDEIILLPGRHVPASFKELQGTAANPIVIRGFDADHPAEIAARDFGLELIRPKYVVLRDLHITSASECGLRISGIPDEGKLESQWYANVRMQGISIDATGNYESGVALKLNGVRQCYISGLECHGWGEVAIDLVASADISIERARFVGTPDFEQTIGARIRAGSHTVRLRQCIFTGVTDVAVDIGGKSSTSEFTTDSLANRDSRPIFEAQQVTLNRCAMRGGASAIRFSSANRCLIQSCTLLDNEYWIYWIDETGIKDGHSESRDIHLSQNIATSRRSDFDRAFRIDGSFDLDGLFINDNLWWFPAIETMELPVQPRIKQQVDIDPHLTRGLYPTNADAHGYGAVDQPPPALKTSHKSEITLGQGTTADASVDQ